MISLGHATLSFPGSVFADAMAPLVVVLSARITAMSGELTIYD
jgi:hypothetical protein